MGHYVYMLASRPGGALYVGRTPHLRQRVQAHRLGLCAHTSRYWIHTLVWFETHEDFLSSLQRERSIKRWRRSWKEELIAEFNPDWRDISARMPDGA